eukprot:CAMPEP_0197314954 /NCGR_PEP_ID=MMETSP0891-20130614/35947_1 /TAXON_ID=44058 ORGANISM="Aureoumbra lagunensis, Strain CCMP1510" /NCGR_SAMPLE_ID=MMETSP0891 /ASSEMBLY_ACC=CAM_ASM_000534 /LENGTH=818 /DNA_ID=CAMNT_0042803659 /DNA_START=213 /DNA_END=2669 /DNA_ORIENTATION=-
MSFLGRRSSQIEQQPQEQASHEEILPNAQEEEVEEEAEAEEEEEEAEEEEMEEDIPERIERLTTLCRRHTEGIEAANAAERAALFEIVRQGAAERAASLNREREQLAAAARHAVTGRAEPVRKASTAWDRLRDCVRGVTLEITDEASGGKWICRVVGVAKPEADASSGNNNVAARLPPGMPSSLARLVRTSGPRSRDSASGFPGAICVEPVLDPNRIPLRSECIGGPTFERLFPRHHAWPQAPFLRQNQASENTRQAKACRLLSLERLSSARIIHDHTELEAVERDIRDRRLIVHYILDEHDACPVKVEPSDIPITQYQIDYETARVSRRQNESDGPQLWNPTSQQNHYRKRVRVRHASSGARLRCRSRRATTLSLDPVELYTTPLPSGQGINVVHMHVNALNDDASVAVIDARSTTEYQSALCRGAAAAVQAAIEATKRKQGLFGRDASGRQLDYAIIADGTCIVAVLVPDVDDDSDDEVDDDTDEIDDEVDDEFLGLPQGLASSRLGISSNSGENATNVSSGQNNNTQESKTRPVETRFIEHAIPAVGSLVSLPDGALGQLRSPLPQGLLIQYPEDASIETPPNEKQTASRFRDQRCRNCGNKCPEALLGIVDVDVVSILAPRPRDQEQQNTLLTESVDPAQLAAVLDMGFDEQNARLALAATIKTGGTADQAVQWLLSRRDANGEDDLVANLIASQAVSSHLATSPIMEHRILDEPRRTAYPVCAIRAVSQQVLDEHRQRLRSREHASAEYASASLNKLEHMLTAPSQGQDKKDILRKARELKEFIDTAVDDGKLVIPPERAARIDRGLRVLAFS